MIDASPRPANVILALTETNLKTEVRRGENSGRTLQHAAVVRSWTPIGKVDASSPFSLTHRVKLQPEWKKDDLRVVVFAQDRQTRKIVAAGSVARS